MSPCPRRCFRSLSLVAACLLAAAWFAGCGETVTTPPQGAHPAGWADPAASGFHGASALQKGLGECMGCHGYPLLGSGQAPACNTCHAMPATEHPTGWQDGTMHGPVVASGGSAACAGCHGSDYRGGTARVSCFACHDGPGGHPLNWNSGHRSFAEVHGTVTCRGCHGADYRGGWSGVSCYQCHNGPGG